MSEYPIPQLKSLWVEVFNGVDADRSADNFLLRHRPHSCFVKKEGEQIVSMVFLNPCSWDGVAGYYLYACATLPQFRGKGYMKNLLNAAFEKAQNENAFGLILVPAQPDLFDFYGKCGFQPFSKIAEGRFFAKDVPDAGFDCEKSYDYDVITDWRSKFYEPSTAVQFEFPHILHIQNHIINEQGATLVFEHDGKRGYAFCTFNPPDKKVVILEWALISNTLHEDLPQFFKGICRYFNVFELSYRSRSGLNLGSERPFSMIRLCSEKDIPENPYFNLEMDW